MPKLVLTYLRRLYFDTALSPSRCAMRPVLDLTGPTRVFFGSDFPYVHGELLELEQLDQLDVFDNATRAAMTQGIALTLFPRFTQTPILNGR